MLPQRSTAAAPQRSRWRPTVRDGIVAAVTVLCLAALRRGPVGTTPAKASAALPPPPQTVTHAAAAQKHLPTRVARRVRVPAESQRTYFTQPTNAKFGAALKARGWTRAARPADAELLWYQRKQLIDWKAVRRWQLTNHVRREGDLGHKGKLAARLLGTAAMKWVPETYQLGAPAGAAAFADRVASEPPPARDEPPRWLLKRPSVDGGKGIEVLRDGRSALDAAGALKPEHAQKLAQRYVRDLLLLDGRKFDLRMYWVVVSFQPVVVVRAGGTLRVSLTAFDATTANGTRAAGQDLTNAAQQAGGHASRDERSRRPLSALWDLLERERRPRWPADARAHVECEVDRAIQAVWDAYAPAGGGAHHLQPRETRDAFILLGADLMIDADLGVYLSEIQSGPGLPTNTRAVRAVVEKLLPDLADLVLAVRAESPRAAARGHAAAAAIAEARGFEVLVANATAPEPRACVKLRA